MSTMDKDLRARISAHIDQGMSNAAIAAKERVSAMTVANVRRYNRDPLWLARAKKQKTDNPAATEAGAPELSKEQALLTIAETMLRASAIIGVEVESVYADKSGNAIVEGTNKGEKVRFEVNVFAK